MYVTCKENAKLMIQSHPSPVQSNRTQPNSIQFNSIQFMPCTPPLLCFACYNSNNNKNQNLAVMHKEGSHIYNSVCMCVCDACKLRQWIKARKKNPVVSFVYTKSLAMLERTDETRQGYAPQCARNQSL